MPRHAALADTAMLTSRCLWEITGATIVARVKQYPVVRIALHLLVMIFWYDERFGCDAFVEQDIRRYHYPRSPHFMDSCKARPGRWKKYQFSYRQQANKEDLAYSQCQGLSIMLRRGLEEAD